MTGDERADAHVHSVRLAVDPEYRMKQAIWGLLYAMVEYKDAHRDLEDAT